MATFFDKPRAMDFAREMGLDPEKTARVLVASRGNHPEITSFLAEAVSAGKGARALDLLLSVSEKDLRDTPAFILADHLYNTDPASEVSRVLCPRVDCELLSPYRSVLQSVVPQSLADSVRRDPALLVDWCRDNLILHDAISLRYVQIQPQRVWETRIADKHSREIFFVAMCRSFGVPAWCDPVTASIKYEKDGVVYDVDFLTIEEGKSTVADLVMRDIKDQIRVIGSFDSEAKYLTLDRVEKSILETTGRGYFAVALVDYGTEPTNHAFMDISAAAAELEAWGRPIVVIFATEDDCRKFRAEHFNLPSTVRFGIDEGGKIRRMMATEMKLEKNGRLPLIVLADTFNRVVFFSQGYSIGLGDSLVKTSKAI